MGKTLGKLAVIGAAIGVAVLTGQVYAAYAALPGAAGAGATLAASAVLAVSTTAIGVALQNTASLVGLGPKAPKPDTTITAIKVPRPPRICGYGRARTFAEAEMFE